MSASEHTSHAETGARMFDHDNAVKMNKHFGPTVDNEHGVYGYIRSADMVNVQARARILWSWAAMGASDYLDTEEALLIEGGKWTTERMVERARDGFERKIGQTEIGIEYTDRPEPKKGFLAGLFSRKKKEEKVEAGPR
ncbi:MAG: hypothetical protein JRM77_07465 [Nitrososphaerota archaeon]|nr:hypothetical protein [Nitrososphaerota archaeon]